MSIVAFVLRRLLHALPLLVCVIVFNFFLIHLAPGDPIQALVGEFPAPESYIADMRKVFGLDQPLYIQLLLYLKNILTGDLGFSFYYRQPVLSVILDRVPATLQLMVPALIFSAVIGILLGILSARKPYSLADHTISVFALFGYCVPAFWLGQMLMAAFAIELGWLPSQGIKTVGVDLDGFSLLLDRTVHVALPFAALAVRHLAVNARMMRSSMLEVAYEDFVTVARAKGLDEKDVIAHHMVPNALMPVVTIIGVDIGFLFTGSVLVETVFGWPGIGRLMYESIVKRDYPVLMGNFLITTALVVIVNLIVDLIYVWLDPRVKYNK
ncbi:MAG TPA: ABC transporter permease [Candidatus Binatia bacterium]|jgi:peptide/nickel transport system permease protein|nr:ABC transporter permease [Candidatus Binatia bacterium]